MKRNPSLTIVTIHLVITSLTFAAYMALFQESAWAQKTVKNPDGSITTIETYPNGNARSQETTTYGPDGKRITGTVRTEYDEDGRPRNETQTIYKDSEVQNIEKTWVYDGRGRLIFFSYVNASRSREARPALPGITHKYKKTIKYTDDYDKKGKTQEEEYSSVNGKWHTIEEGDQVTFTNPEKLQEPVQKLPQRTKTTAGEAPVPSPKPTQPEPKPSPNPKSSSPPNPRTTTGAIDPCLVGTWRSESVRLLDSPLSGGDGIALTIKADGTVIINYSEMSPIKSFAGESNTWSGSATFHITTEKGRAIFKSADKSEVTHTYTDPNGVSRSNDASRGAPFAALGVDPFDKAYQCERDTLMYKRVPDTFTFKRQENPSN
jgi:hypothetical protein